MLVNFDTATYALAVPAGTVTPLTATARLYYQTASNYYIEFLRDEAVNAGFQDENSMCSGGPDRPFTVGPQSRTRGEYAYELWNNAPDDTTAAGLRQVAAGADADQRGDDLDALKTHPFLRRRKQSPREHLGAATRCRAGRATAHRSGRTRPLHIIYGRSSSGLDRHEGFRNSHWKSGSADRSMRPLARPSKFMQRRMIP